MFSSNTTQTSGGYQISRSLRFNRADSAYLSRTPASAGNRKAWTMSFWVKRCDIVNRQILLEQFLAASDTGYSSIEFASDAAAPTLVVGGYNTTWRITTQVFRDVSAWYHIVVAVDTTQATANNRVRLYVNGVEITSFSLVNNPTQNADTGANSTGAAAIGSSISGSTNLNGYMTEIYMVDGTQLTPSSFGETNADTGVWQPKAYVGTYGTNGFYLNFSDNSNTTAATLGKDSSGNGNNWTPNNFSVTAGVGNDSLVDSPTRYGTDTGVGGTVRGNYCTWNPLSTGGGVVLSNGNLRFSKTSSTCIGAGTMFASSGKWYFEYTCTSSVNMVGVIRDTDSPKSMDYVGYTANSYGYYYNGQKFNNNSSASYGSSYTTNDVIGVALDMDAGTVAFYKNGTSQGTAFTGLSGNFTIASGDNTTLSGELNAGQRPFAYTAPSGYKALCTTNLPTPAVGATTATQASKYFNTVLYTGNGSGQAINTGIDESGKVALTWLKGRVTAYSNYLFDTTRGNGAYLSSNSIAAESTDATMPDLTSTGFTLKTNAGSNANAEPFVSWTWAAGNLGTSNTDGSITSTVSANTTSGFSVVTYTGAAGSPVSGTVGHGLGVAPKMIIVKARNYVDSWYVYHSAVGNTKFLELNATTAATTYSTMWNNTDPTSTVFSTSYLNQNSNTYVAYCFAEVAGYSKFGTYTGNSSTDGPFVYCGFRPRYIMVKPSSQDIGPGSGWHIIDTARSPYNAATNDLLANAAYSEADIGTSYPVDINSNGFKWRTSNSYINNSGQTYIFAAFAEAPFNYSLAR